MRCVKRGFETEVVKVRIERGVLGSYVFKDKFSKLRVAGEVLKARF